MKNTITLNIGLSSGTGPCAPHLILADLRHHGFRVLSSRIASGVWHGKPEVTLVIGAAFALPLEYSEARLCIAYALTQIAAKHHQECIAVQWPDGTGDLFPVCAYSFDPAYFHQAQAPTYCTGCGQVVSGW